jgi:hypothetical protein
MKGLVIMCMLAALYISANWITAAMVGIVALYLVRTWRSPGGPQACLATAAACAAVVGSTWLLVGSAGALVMGAALFALAFFAAAFGLLEEFAEWYFAAQGALDRERAAAARQTTKTEP